MIVSVVQESNCCLPVLAITEIRVWIPQTITVSGLVLHLVLLGFVFMYFEALLLGTFIFRIFLSSWRIDSFIIIKCLLFYPEK